jgi:hypothetical protein
VTALPRPSEHAALRPLWICRIDAQPWPCADARIHLTRRYRDKPVALYVQLGGLLAEAMADLYTLDAYGAPDPGTLSERFLGWAPPRRPS